MDCTGWIRFASCMIDGVLDPQISRLHTDRIKFLYHGNHSYPHFYECENALYYVCSIFYSPQHTDSPHKTLVIRN